MESVLSADKKIELLSEEELQCVLQQLTDHNIPEREKCPLVQRLSAQASSTTYSTSTVRTLNRSSGGKLRSRLHPALSKANDLTERNLIISQAPNHRPPPQSHCGSDKSVNYAQSLHELSNNNSNNNNCDDNTCLNLPAAISNTNTEIVATVSSSTSHLRCGGSNLSNRKPNRANSFTMPSQSDNNDSNKNDSALKFLDHHLITNGSEVSRETFCAGDKQTVNANACMSSNHKSSNFAATAANNCSPQQTKSCSNSSHYSSGDTSADRFYFSNKSSSSKFSSIHLDSIETLVNQIPLPSENVSSSHSGSSDERVTINNTKQLNVQEEDEEKPQFCETKYLHSNFKYINYQPNMNVSLKNSKYTNSEDYSVDKCLEMPMLNNNCEYNNSYNYNQSILFLFIFNFSVFNLILF